MNSATLDITREVCPMTWVRVKLALEALESGDLLEVFLQGVEPLKNVPMNCRDDGHDVVSLETLFDGRSRMLVRVGVRT